MAIPDRIEFPHQLRLFIKRNKTQKFCCYTFSFTMWCLLGVEMLCNLEVVNHHSSQPQTSKEPPTPPPRLPLKRSGGGQGGVF